MSWDFNYFTSSEVLDSDTESCLSLSEHSSAAAGQFQDDGHFQYFLHLILCQPDRS
jgi:hypothetical protein